MNNTSKYNIRMSLQHFFLPLLALLTFLNGSAQEVVVRPFYPKTTDSVTITYDASKGNRALFNTKETVYFHAGLITSQSRDERDWKFTVGNWGTADEKVKMQKAGDNLYVASFVPTQLFKVAETVEVLQMAFVFRNHDGSVVGKTSDEKDIYVPMFGYTPPVEVKSVYLFNEILFEDYIHTTTHLQINTNQGAITLRPFSDSIVETHWHPSGFETFLPSHAVAAKPKEVKTWVAEAGNRLMYDLPGLQVLIQKQPFKISYLINGRQLLEDEKGFFARTDGAGMRFKLSPNEKLYGSGGRASGINLRGRKLGLYNRPDYNYEFGADNLNYLIPSLLSSNNYMLLVDNPQKAWFDIDSKGDEVLEFGAIGGPMRYFVIGGDKYSRLLEQYSALTGKQPMLPRWAFGNLQSRMAYRTQEETTAIVDQMIAEDFPIDAVIIDFYWFGDSILGHLGRLDWWEQSWPDPQKMISDFASKGVKTITISEPYIIDSLANWHIADSLGILAKDSLGNSYIDYEFYFGNGSLIDIFMPEAQQWLWEQYLKQFDIGVAGLWGDLGEPESHPSDMVHIWGKADEVHNIYGHYWTKSIYDNFRKTFPEKRLFFLARSGFAGTQRYGIIPWSGDVSRSWAGLKAQLPSMLNMSMSGVPYMHSDAGGFATGIKDDELYTRWLQFAVFTPILRPHGSGIPSEPIFFNDTTKRIVRHFMKLRYELMPYIYTAGWKNSTTGLPIVKPLFFYHPDDERFESSFESYYFGEHLLIAPVLGPKIRQMEIELPNGLWYHFWTGKKTNGGQKVQLQTALESIPVFVKSGSIIPRVEAVNTTDYYSSRRLFLHTYLPGKDGKFFGQMYEDDGISFDSYGNKAFELLQFEGWLENGILKMNLTKSGEGWFGMPESRMIETIIYGMEKNIRFASIAGKELQELKDTADSNQQGFWQSKEGTWHARFVWHGQPIEMEVR